MPPRAASDSASSSARSAVSATAPTSASIIRLTGSSMGPRPAALPATLTLLLCGRRRTVGAVHRRNRCERGCRLRGGGVLRALELRLEPGLGDGDVLAPCELRLPLLPHRQ